MRKECFNSLELATPLHRQEGLYALSPSMLYTVSFKVGDKLEGSNYSTSKYKWCFDKVVEKRVNPLLNVMSK